LFLLRHGATENNLALPPRLQGRHSDPPVSDEGRLQSQRTAECLAAFELRAVYSSPLLRARQTAQAIADRHGLPVTSLPELIEVDVGVWEGRDWDEIERNDAAAYRAFVENPADTPYHGGESFRAVSQRVLPLVERLASEHRGEQIAIVAHNVVNRVVLAPLLGLPLAQARGIRQENCGVNLIRYRDGTARLITLNSVLHLPPRAQADERSS
jgi:broad specificity phosphatase PhoE